MKFRTFLVCIVLLAGFVTPSPAVDPEIYFSRSDPVSKVIIREINAAQKSIHLLMYSFTDDDIAAALLAAAKRGIDLKIVFDRSQTEEKNSLAPLLLDKLGPNLVKFRAGRGRGIMHEKMAVYDGLTVTLGSYNWTENARANNWENLLVLRDARLAAECDHEFHVIWSSPEPGTGRKKK